MAQTLRVLIVEDTQDDAELVLRELGRGGYDTVWECVETPEAMSEALGRQAWDIVISDHKMPRFSAPAALALVKERGLDIPFIIVSGSMGEELAVEAMRGGASDYILKDRLARLSAAVAREIREAEVRRAHAQAQRTLTETQDRLDSAMRQLLQAEKLTALGELVCGVAHEINNPLSTIMGYCQLLTANDLPAEVRGRLDTMLSEAGRMARIVKNLLTFARKHPPERDYRDLNGIIEKTLELKAYHFRVSQIQVEKDLAPDLPMTMLDFHQIQQVFLNLLNNAEQALMEEGRGGTIRLATRRAGGRIEARVSDNGPGVPAEIQARIFEPFFTTKREGKGTGLGLSMCYGIIQEHGGTIRLESPPGAGAAFVVELPILEEAGPAREEALLASSSRVPRLRVLVIDDEQAVRSVLVELLRAKGHEVDTASDVPEALQKLASGDHDLVICDMKMPRGTGKDVYEAVAGKRPRLARRLVFTTGDGASTETRRFLRETGSEIVLKPFRIEEIEGAIARALQDR